MERVNCCEEKSERTRAADENARARSEATTLVFNILNVESLLRSTSSSRLLMTPTGLTSEED